MRTASLLRLSGFVCVVGGACLVIVIVSHGGCLGDACYARPLPGTGDGEAALGLAAVGLLFAAAVGLVAGAGRYVSVGRSGSAAAVCAASGVVFGTAATITVARTHGETWLMPVFVFPALFSVTAAIIMVAALVRRAQLAPRWLTIVLIVAASLLPLFTQQDPNDFIPAVFGVACVALGVHLILDGGRSPAGVDEKRQPPAG